MNDSQIDIKVVAKDLASATIREVKNQVSGLGSSAQSASSGSQLLEGAVIGLTSAVTSFGLSIVSSGIENLVGWFQGAVDSASDFERQMITLGIISERFGQDVDKVRLSAESLGKELRIGTGPAAESLQNLLKSGLNIDQAADLMKRFTNEALTGKSSSISLSQAVQNLSFAYATNNSALGNLSGISENFNDIVEKGRLALIAQGKAADDITPEMAKYQGMIDLTNQTMGASALMTGTYADKQAELNFKFDEFQRNIGTLLLPILSNLLDTFSNIFSRVSPKLENWANEIIPEIGRVLEEDVIPWVEDFVEYLGSEQFKRDIEGIKNLFVDIKDTVSEVIRLIGVIVDDPSFRSVLEFGSGVGKQVAAKPLEGAVPILPILRHLGILPKYANGTDFHPGGLAIVGEKGPEIVDLPRGSRVSSGVPSQTFFNFYGYDSEQISTKINQQLKLGY